MSRELTTCLIFVGGLLWMFADKATARTPQEGIRGVVGDSPADQMFYRYYLPQDYDPQTEYPLLLSLHYSGQEGRDNFSQVGASNTANLIELTDVEFPAILVAPQLRVFGSSWDPEDPRDRTDEVLDAMISSFSVDTDRLYVIGHSLGGLGTTTYLQHYNVYHPDRFRFAAGAALVASQVDDPLAAEALRETPIWLFHGAEDDRWPVEIVRQSFNLLAGNPTNAPIEFNDSYLGEPTAVAGSIRYTEFPGVGHALPDGKTIDGREFFEWMFSQSLAVPEPSTSCFAMLSLFFANVCCGRRTLCLRQERSPTVWR